MKFLSVLSCLPPHSFGGAEVSAKNFALWLAKQGMDVTLFGTSEQGEPELRGAAFESLKMWRLQWPRTHTLLKYDHAPKVEKLVWQYQDLFDPRNRSLFGQVLDEVKPDFVNLHVVKGIGFNALYEIARRDIPAIFFMHDLALVCARSDMFRNGKSCTRQCGTCRVVSKVRFKAAASIPRVTFVSPSRANLATAARFLPLERYSTASILNANFYPKATVPRMPSDHLRFLYVGRLHVAKGVHVLLQALSQLAGKHKFSLTIAGAGPDEEALRNQFGNTGWCQFAGFVSQAKVANLIHNSDLLCIPSIWRENSPGVVINALQHGLPVIGSDSGGIPEYIEHEKNGLVVPAGDVTAWTSVIARVLNDPSVVGSWRAYAEANATTYEQDHIGRELLACVEATMNLPRDRSQHSDKI